MCSPCSLWSTDCAISCVVRSTFYLRWPFIFTSLWYCFIFEKSKKEAALRFAQFRSFWMCASYNLHCNFYLSNCFVFVLFFVFIFSLAVLSFTIFSLFRKSVFVIVLSPYPMPCETDKHIYLADIEFTPTPILIQPFSMGGSIRNGNNRESRCEMVVTS